ncbi:hypothetical protein C0Q70_07675 [Pomacea canaliculata]|uniref:Uncharacterized protein n=2 Tax=Pomacea canaliculata TaxID=400727 RepID=A0A2T7PFP1_POMCA|nr:hypothetical protein C0Q70_07675 [Pomacea canaliculata]
MYLSVCLAMAALLGGSWAQSGYDYVGPYGPRQDIELASKARRVIKEAETAAAIENALQKKLDMSKAQVIQLLTVLDNINTTTIQSIINASQQQQDRLSKLSAKVKSNLELLTSLENRLAGAVVQEAEIRPSSVPIEELLALDRKQKADLAAFDIAFGEVTRELEQQLSADNDTATSSIATLAASIGSLVKFVNSRKCITKAATIELKGQKSADIEIPIPPGVFAAGDVPQVFSALQGFQLAADVSRSVAPPVYGPGAFYGPGPGYANYPESDDRRFLGVSVVSKAFADKIRVTVVDQSQGAGNNVAVAYVQVKACSLPPAAFSPGQVLVSKPNKY